MIKKQARNLKAKAKKTVYIGRKIDKKIRNRFSVTNDYTFSVDSPRKTVYAQKSISVEGWILPKNDTSFTMRVRNNNQFHPVRTSVKRVDVKKAYPDLPQAKTLYSGFKSVFEFEDGDIVLEIDSGKGFKELYRSKIQYAVEDMPKNIYNKNLAANYSEHLNLIDNRKQYYSEHESEADYSRHHKDTRLMAMYLPQFHPFEENDKNWGKGFTEWTNVTAAKPRFIGHQQPMLPADLGFYDLRLDASIAEQIKLAKKYGVYGFCFYYYWFSGKKLMDKPINSFLSHKEWDFNFSICWANENWTKRWDGRDDDVIIAQDYLDTDPIDFIKDVEHILLDPRYVCEDGKPVLTVYRASDLKEPQKYAEAWRHYFRTKHKRELQLVSVLSFDDQDPREYGFDAALDFAPLSIFFKNHQFTNNQFPHLDVSQKLLDINFSGVVADYRTIALNEKLDRTYRFPTYPCVMPSWDNDARRKGKGFVFLNSNPDLYAVWLDRIISKQQKDESPLVFVNAWNEWAEGAILEPSEILGHATLKRTAEVLSKYSHDKKNQDRFPLHGLRRDPATKLAVVVHLYYVDLWPEIRDRLSLIRESFDLFVTLNTRDKDFVPDIKNHNVGVSTIIVPNRGRDVLPFLMLASKLRLAGYKHLLKLHGKKSKHRKDGSNWFSDVLENLLPTPEVITQVIQRLSQQSTGLIGPRPHLVSLKRHMGSNAPIVEHLVERSFGKKVSNEVMRYPENFPYFGGTMFWARLDVLDSVLDLCLMPDDFQSEHGQIDGTTAHAVERMFGISATVTKRSMLYVSNIGIEQVPNGPYTDKYKYAP